MSLKAKSWPRAYPASKLFIKSIYLFSLNRSSNLTFKFEFMGGSTSSAIHRIPFLKSPLLEGFLNNPPIQSEQIRERNWPCHFNNFFKK